MLVGYYLGKVEQKALLRPLESRETFEASPFGRLGVQGLTYDGMRCEFYFYDALLQGVSGDPSTRSKRYESRFREVTKVGYANLYEYIMAHYLLDRFTAGS